jgi:pimeloyl-ACP methyl ester carboxylesterase
MLGARPTATLTVCDDDPSWLCGSIAVPVDRAHPLGRTLSIGFSVLPHTDQTSAATDAVFASDGGPGNSSTAGKGFFTYLLGAITDERDLVLVDNRGTGRSGAIDCPGLQVEPPGHDAFLAAVAACGAQLGGDADRYGAGDIAMDIEAVRKALGYPKITYYGQSYGTVDVSAYAVRYPERLRAVVLDAGLTVNDPAHAWGWGLGVPSGMADAVTLTCQRAPACAAANPDPDAALRRLAAELRKHPVVGTIMDDYGAVRTVRVDESKLISIVESGQLAIGQIPAVEKALRTGDPVPLLRLATEAPDRGGDNGDPAQYSAGDNIAAFCNDQNFVFRRSDPISVRQHKYDAALTALPVDAFAPFTKSVWAGWFYDDACVAWPAPDRFVPAVPDGSVVRGVPALILHGDLDTSVARLNSRDLLRIFPGGTYRDVAGAGHPSAGWSSCSSDLAQAFIADPSAPVGRCPDPAFVGMAVPAYPTNVTDATPATRASGDDSTVSERRAATVAVRSLLDCFMRTFTIPDSSGTTPGLRGGSFDWEFGDDQASITLRDVVFSEGVSVSGTASLAYAGNRLSVHLAVRAPAGMRLSLEGSGQWGFSAPFADFDVTGSSDGRGVHLVVPAN